MTEIFRDARKDAGYCPKCQKGYAIGPHVCPLEQPPSKDVSISFTQRHDLIGNPWAISYIRDDGQHQLLALVDGKPIVLTAHEPFADDQIDAMLRRVDDHQIDYDDAIILVRMLQELRQLRSPLPADCQHEQAAITCAKCGIVMCEPRNAPPPCADQCEIATIEVRDDAIVKATMKAPGLPDGEHDLFCAPVAAQPPAVGPWQVFMVPKTGDRGVLNEEHHLTVTGPFGDDDEKRVYCERLATALNCSASPPPAIPGKFDLAFEIMRMMDREELDTLQSCHFGYVLRVTREGAAQPPRNVHGLIYDRDGWVCSVCHGWNHSRDKHCTHTHRAIQTKGA
jgi:hypothetical protein